MTGLAAILTGDGPLSDRRTAWLDYAAGTTSAERAAETFAVLSGARAPDCPLAASGPGEAGALACGSPHAARAGMELLRAGGTAADAASGAAFAMMVADPPNASPAGRAHILWARPGERARAIDGATSVPSSMPEGLSGLPDSRALPVPGAVRAILRLHAQAGRLPLAAVAAPARELARDGFEVPAELARIWALRAPEIADDDARRIYLPGGEAPRAGARFVHRRLAAFFEHLTATGADPFADPDFARGFCDRVARKGARWSVEALAAAEARDGETVSFRGTGWRLTSIGRQGWGDTLLRIAALSASRTARSSLDAELVHLGAVLRGFEERPEELRSLQPKPHPIPWETLRARVGEPPSGDWAAPAALAASAARMRGPATARERDTTHLSVVDREGMRVALTQSIGPHFGARVADPETGVLLAHSYRMTHTPEPGARDVTEQCPCLLDLRGAEYALGGAGSERIPGAVAAVIRGLLGGLDLAGAVIAPRTNWAGDRVRCHVDAPPGLEGRLSRAGVAVSITGRGPVEHLGVVQAAGRHAGGRLEAAADPAYAGVALAG